ncbi:MAG: hypothetical protein D6820_06870, partial [Lentisphaerae bacterium]
MVVQTGSRTWILTEADGVSQCSGEVFVRYFGYRRDPQHLSFRKIPRAICSFFQVAGEAEVSIGSATFKLVKGNLVFAWPEEVMDYHGYGAEGVGYYFFNLKGARVDSVLERCCIFRHQRYRACPALLQPLLAAHHTVSCGRYSGFYPVSLAWQILDILSATDAGLEWEADSRFSIFEGCREVMESEFMN